VLSSVAEALRDAPSELLGVDDVAFEAHTAAQLHMAFVYLAERFMKMHASEMRGLHDAVQQRVAAAADAATAPITLCGLELYPPDRSLVVARFKVPETLMSLRKAVWRVCREHKVAFPDAIWMPHVVIGRIRATRGQVNHVSCARLSGLAPRHTTRPLGLTLTGGRPKSVQCDWDEALLFQKALMERTCCDDVADVVACASPGVAETSNGVVVSSASADGPDCALGHTAPPYTGAPAIAQQSSATGGFKWRDVPVSRGANEVGVAAAAVQAPAPVPPPETPGRTHRGRRAPLRVGSQPRPRSSMGAMPA